MKLKMSLALLAERVRENQFVIHTALLALIACGGAAALLGRRRRAIRIFSQVHRSTRSALMRRAVEPYVVRHRAAIYVDARRGPGAEDIVRQLGRRIAVLKEPGAHGERGVLFVMFSETLPVMFAAMDVPKLMSDYTIVSEPTWSGYCDEDLLRWTQFGEDMFVLAAQRDDFAFLQRLRSNLIPVPLGCCDWVDPRVAEPHLDSAKEFDIVMNSHWGGSKRHHVLFRFLRAHKRKLRVLLIGGSWEGRTIDDIRSLAAHYGVGDQLTILERLPFTDVMAMTCRARVSILLSLKEGSNRAIAESIFCNVPVVVLKNHVGGILKNVVPETGLCVEERHLGEAIRQLSQSDLAPREWAIANISCFESSRRLNEILRQRAVATRKPWTRDIAPRANSPESRYVCEADAVRLAPWNQRLTEYLR